MSRIDRNSTLKAFYKDYLADLNPASRREDVVVGLGALGLVANGLAEDLNSPRDVALVFGTERVTQLEVIMQILGLEVTDEVRKDLAAESATLAERFNQQRIGE